MAELAEVYGAVFPAVTDVRDGVIYGVNGSIEGTGLEDCDLRVFTCIDTAERPVKDVVVTVTSDIEGNVVIGSSRLSNSNGETYFELDAGTVYVWQTPDAFNAVNPTEVILV